MVSVASAILFFSIATIAYFVISYLLADRFNSRNQGIATACTVVYLAIIVSIQTYNKLSIIIYFVLSFSKRIM